jgi:predicted Zn-dependent peptidase
MTITCTELPNGLPLYQIPLDGTRAVTGMVAYEAGARAERPEENGIAHFLEHLVFKGGESYPSRHEINQATELLGGRFNAYTSHEVVAFYIRVRAERALEAIDLLTDVVGRARIDDEELERERGVVIQEIARASDQPSERALELSSRAAFGTEHPLGRSVLGSEERIRSFSRDDVVAFRARSWSGSAGAAFVVGNCDGVRDASDLEELFARLPSGGNHRSPSPPPPFAPRIEVEERDSSQSHLVLDYRPEIDVGDARMRAAFAVYAMLLGGSMGSRLVDEIRERRGLAYSIRATADAYSDAAVLEVAAGLDRANCVPAYRRIRAIVDELAEREPSDEEVERARSCAAGRRALAFENSTTAARHVAEEQLLHGSEVGPAEAVAALDAVTHAQVTAIARRVGAECSVTCVGPHRVEDFA